MADFAIENSTTNAAISIEIRSKYKQRTPEASRLGSFQLQKSSFFNHFSIICQRKNHHFLLKNRHFRLEDSSFGYETDARFVPPLKKRPHSLKKGYKNENLRQIAGSVLALPCAG